MVGNNVWQVRPLGRRPRDHVDHTLAATPGGPRDDLPFDGGLDDVIDLHHDED
jgi:hypothetical protein